MLKNGNHRYVAVTKFLKKNIVSTDETSTISILWTTNIYFKTSENSKEVESRRINKEDEFTLPDLPSTKILRIKMDE
jgi:hypothetical protein